MSSPELESTREDMWFNLAILIPNKNIESHPQNRVEIVQL